MQIIGKSRPIHDAVEKATGAAVYAGDLRLRNMAFAALIRSSIPHGYVEAIDFSTIKQMEGVLGWMSCLDGNNDNLFCRYRTVKGQQTYNQEHIWNRRVRFIGDRIGCILATSLDIAREAAARVCVQYRELAHALTVEESLSGKIIDIHKEGFTSKEIIVEVGQIPSGEFIHIDTTSKLARINHVALEPHVCTANYNAYTKELTVWSPNQSVHGIRTVLCDIFSLPYHKVRVIKTTMGGSFGGKQEWIVEPIAALAAMYYRGSVQLTLTREEVFQSTICRAPMDIKVSGMYSKDGDLISMQVDNTLDAGAYMGNSEDYCGAMANKFFRCYKYPHMKYTGRAVITNTPVSGAFRGWTSPELALCLEHNINMAARFLEIDPLELRLKNVALPGDKDIRLQATLGEIHLKECLEMGRSLFQWDKRKALCRKNNLSSRRLKQGIAVACGGHLNGYFPRVNDFAAVEMRMTEHGEVLVNITLHDHGCGTVEVFRMIVAETLGLTPDEIYIREGDTAVTPFDYGCFSSRTTYVLGRAARECALLLINKLCSIIIEIHKVDKASLKVSNGSVYAPDMRWTFAQIVQESHAILQKEVSVRFQYINKTNPGVTCAHFALVEVDIQLGNVNILDYLAVHDIGKALNPEICRGQIQGAVAMGAGAALREDVAINNRGIATNSLRKYHILNLPEIPKIRVEFVEFGGTDGPFGCKSIGEISHVPPAAVIVGAVNDALKSDLCTLPLSQDKIGAWLEQNISKLE